MASSFVAISAGLLTLQKMITGDETNEHYNKTYRRFRATWDHRLYAIADNHDGGRLYYFEKTTLV